jgi:outer membrane protein assembly factor BamB
MHKAMGLVALLLMTVAGRGEDWPCWRGAGHDGVSKESGWVDTWPQTGPTILWKANVGIGFSSFSVAGGKVYTAGNSDNTDTVYCFDAESGKVLWKHSYTSDLGDKFFEGGTTGTPTVDGSHVYFLSRWGDLFCFDAASGKVIWSKNLHKDTGVRIPGWGFGGSVLAFENLLVLNVGEAGMALDKNSGNVVWKSANKDAGYSTPLPVERSGKRLALLASEKSYLAVDLLSGKEAWRIKWLTQYGVNAADPIVDGDRVLISSGYDKGAALLKMTDGSEPQVLWKSKIIRTQTNPGVKIGDYVYAADGDAPDSPVLKCIEFGTGKQKWEQPDVPVGGITAADGKLIVMSQQGELMVAPASPEGFKVTSRAQVLGGKCWVVPVLANGRIYCRNARGDVVCVDVRRK